MLPEPPHTPAPMYPTTSSEMTHKPFLGYLECKLLVSMASPLSVLTIRRTSCTGNVTQW